jgi:D-alanyl-lipoteichoic acid acyltransferase DltB (MBOAT superfamily)
MLFNSFEFLFAFLPLTVIVFFVLGTKSRSWALGWLILASLGFYAWWRPLNVLIIAPSIVINYFAAQVLLRLGQKEDRKGAARTVLLLGVAFNIAFLGYFKYTDFFAGSINDVFGTNLVLLHIILPLGISFITFQKIAFLMDVHSGRVKSVTFRDYCLFVLFFPQLIAGPIVHYREMMPQFQNAPCRFDKENVAVGLTLLCFGLFKKVVLADSIAPFVTPIYEQAAADGGTTLLFAWIAAFGFTLQLYFDFSGYSDMALGLARFFGVKLPQNFDSPLKATSIADFWARWHMTLTRFLTGYLYNPLVLWLTRRRASKGLPGLVAGKATVGAFASLIVFPMLLTMFLSGVWHGAGYTFIIFGLLHGVYLTINHAWRQFGSRLWRDRATHDRWMNPIGWMLVFIGVMVANVFFRSPTVATALDILKGMVGLHGLALPQAIYEGLGPVAGMLQSIGVKVMAPGLWSQRDFMLMMAWIVGLALIAYGFPNTLQILARYEPALGVKPPAAGAPLLQRALAWTTSLPWAVAVSVLALVGVLKLGGPSAFLYWQF